MDFKYIIPNLNKFIKTDNYFCLEPDLVGSETYGQLRRLGIACIGGVVMVS